MDDKKIVCISHADFDGAVAPFIIEFLLKNSSHDAHFKTYYGDFYNLKSILDECLKQQDITHMLITDVSIDQEMKKKIECMINRGVNVIYADHHKNPQRDKIFQNLEWAYIDSESNIGSSQQILHLITRYFENKFGEDYIQKVLTTDLKPKIDPKYVNQGENKVFSSFFGEVLSDIKYNDVRRILPQISQLSYAATLLDYKRSGEILGLDKIIQYWDIALEYRDGKLYDVLEDVLRYTNNLPNNLGLIEEHIRCIKKANVYDDKEIVSLNSTFTGYAKGNNDKYTFTVGYGDGCVRWRLEDLRKTCNTDLFITFTRASINRYPLFTVKSGKGINILDFAANCKKEERYMGGAVSEIAITYDKAIYDKIMHLRDEICRIRHNIHNDIQTNSIRLKIKNSQIQSLIKQVLQDNFKEICLSDKLKHISHGENASSMGKMLQIPAKLQGNYDLLQRTV